MTKSKTWAGVYGAIAAGLHIFPAAAGQKAEEVHIFRIPSEDANSAIQAFGLQADLDILVDFDLVREKRLPDVSGKMSVDEGLRKLLAGSGLTYVYQDNRAVNIVALRSREDPTSARDRPSGRPLQVSEADSKILVIEEIVVTAQKRPELLQDIPISAQVLLGNELAQQNLNFLADISQIAPSVNVVGTVGRSGSLYIRGIGSGVGTAFDQSVGTFVDDIYHGRTQYSLEQFLDLDRVEILKGPQSTFFGNDAIAGAFNIVTKKPSDDYEASLRGLYGTFGQYEAEGAVNVPIDDHFQIRAAALASGEDGWLHNVNTGERYPAENNVAARITAQLRPSDYLEATLKIEGSQIRDGGGLFLSVVGCPPPAPFVASGFCKSIDASVPQGMRSNSTSETPGQKADLSTQEEVLTINYQLWDHTITSVSGFSAYHFQQNLDVAGTPLNELNVSTPEHYVQTSQELRVASAQNRKLEYLAGIYFQADELVNDANQVYFLVSPTISATPSLSSLVPYLPLAQDINYRQQEHIYSVFASSTWHVTDALSISGGLRDSQVYKNYNWHLFYGTAEQAYGSIVALPQQTAILPAAIGLGTPATLSGARSDHALTPSFHAQYQLDQMAMLYFSYNRGFKAGGFNAGDNSGQAKNLPFDPEHVNAYEFGLKSKLFDKQVLLDFDVFRSNYTNLQVTQNFPNAAGSFVSTVGNAAAVLSQGVEFEGKWIIGRHFSAAVDGTYLDSRYTSYPDAAPTTLQAYEGHKAFNETGWTTFYAPKWSGALTGTYLADLPGGYSFLATIEPIAASNNYHDVVDRLAGAYVRVDNRLTLESPGGRWNFDLIGHNLTDRDINVFQGPQVKTPGTLLVQKEPPRSIALQVRVKW